MLLLDIWLVPAYGFAGALAAYGIVYFACEPTVLVGLLLAGKPPMRRMPGVMEDMENFKFHLRKSLPEMGTYLAHKAGGMCLSFASGTLSAAAMLASSIFLDFVDGACSIGTASTVPVNAVSATERRCLGAGLLSVMGVTAVVLAVMMGTFPYLIDLLTADADVAGMLMGASWMLVSYVAVSNAADVVGSVLRGKLLNGQVGTWAMISMVVFRCAGPFVAAPFGFTAIVSCFALNRLFLLAGYSGIAWRNRREYEY